MTYTGPTITNLSDLSHASRDGKTTLCGKAVFPSMNQRTAITPKMVWRDGLKNQFWSVPSCRTCRENIKDEEYSPTIKP